MATRIVIWDLAMIRFGIATKTGWDGYWLSRSGKVRQCDLDARWERGDPPKSRLWPAIREDFGRLTAPVCIELANERRGSLGRDQGKEHRNWQREPLGT
jgi:hypothetical protein